MIPIVATGSNVTFTDKHTRGNMSWNLGCLPLQELSSDFRLSRSRKDTTCITPSTQGLYKHDAKRSASAGNQTAMVTQEKASLHDEGKKEGSTPTTKDGALDQDLLRVGITYMDYYFSSPREHSASPNFRGTLTRDGLARLPVVRIFGATPAGQNVCVHLHGLLPRFFVPLPQCIQDENADEYARELHYALEVAVERALHGSDAPATTNEDKEAWRAQSECEESELRYQRKRYIFEVRPVRRRSIYGYNRDMCTFLRIAAFNPMLIGRLAAMCASGVLPLSAGAAELQPYESHIPFNLQVLVEHNLVGMGQLKLAACRFRLPLPAPTSSLDGSQPEPYEDVANSAFEAPLGWRRYLRGLEIARPDLFWSFAVPRRSSSELELDAFADDVLNARELRIFDADGFTDTYAVSTLRVLWDEQQRLDPSISSSKDLAAGTAERSVLAGAHLSDDRMSAKLRDNLAAMQKHRSTATDEEGKEHSEGTDDALAHWLEANAALSKPVANDEALRIPDAEEENHRKEPGPELEHLESTHTESIKRQKEGWAMLECNDTRESFGLVENADNFDDNDAVWNDILECTQHEDNVELNKPTNDLPRSVMNNLEMDGDAERRDRELESIPQLDGLHDDEEDDDVLDRNFEEEHRLTAARGAQASSARQREDSEAGGQERPQLVSGSETRPDRRRRRLIAYRSLLHDRLLRTNDRVNLSSQAEMKASVATADKKEEKPASVARDAVVTDKSNSPAALTGPPSARPPSATRAATAAVTSDSRLHAAERKLKENPPPRVRDRYKPLPLRRASITPTPLTRRDAAGVRRKACPPPTKTRCRAREVQHEISKRQEGERQLGQGRVLVCATPDTIVRGRPSPEKSKPKARRRSIERATRREAISAAFGEASYRAYTSTSSVGRTAAHESDIKQTETETPRRALRYCDGEGETTNMDSESTIDENDATEAPTQPDEPSKLLVQTDISAQVEDCNDEVMDVNEADADNPLKSDFSADGGKAEQKDATHHNAERLQSLEVLENIEDMQSGEDDPFWRNAKTLEDLPDSVEQDDIIEMNEEEPDTGWVEVIAPTVFSRNKSLTTLHAALQPPTAQQLLWSVRKEGVPPSVHTTPFYGRRDDVPLRPRSFAGVHITIPHNGVESFQDAATPFSAEPTAQTAAADARCVYVISPSSRPPLRSDLFALSNSWADPSATIRIVARTRIDSAGREVVIDEQRSDKPKAAVAQKRVVETLVPAECDEKATSTPAPEATPAQSSKEMREAFRKHTTKYQRRKALLHVRAAQESNTASGGDDSTEGSASTTSGEDNNEEDCAADELNLGREARTSLESRTNPNCSSDGATVMQRSTLPELPDIERPPSPKYDETYHFQALSKRTPSSRMSTRGESHLSVVRPGGLPSTADGARKSKAPEPVKGGLAPPPPRGDNRPGELDDTQRSATQQHISIGVLELFAASRGQLRPDPSVDALHVIALVSREHSKRKLRSAPLQLFVYDDSSDLPADSVECDAMRKCRRRSWIAPIRSVATSGSQLDVHWASTEAELFNMFTEFIQQVDPDIIAGYDVQSDSLGYLVERGAALGVDVCEAMARMKLHRVMSNTNEFVQEQPRAPSQDQKHEVLSSDRRNVTLPPDKSADDGPGSSTRRQRVALEYMRRSPSGGFEITGRHVINVWRVVRAEVKLNAYTFENVAAEVLGQRVAYHPPRQLSRWFFRDAPRRRFATRVLSEVLRRAENVLNIMETLDAVGRASELARVYGIDFMSVFTRGSQYRVESMLLRLSHARNFLLLAATREQVFRQPAVECLPLVMEPISRYYVDPVIVLDFRSLYPSMVIAHNLCYSTMLGSVKKVRSWSDKRQMGIMPDFAPPPPSHIQCHGEWQSEQSVTDRLFVSSNGEVFCTADVRVGVLPQLLREILDTRVMIKKAMRGLASPSNDQEDEDDSGVREGMLRRMNARQFALKMIANVTYGYTSASYSGRMPCAGLADTIVQCGRDALDFSAAQIHERWGPSHGARVVYGDTDSLFVLLPGATRAEAHQVGQSMAEEISAAFPAPVKLQMEKVYFPCMLLTKKRYVGNMYESPTQLLPMLDAKGVESIRRETCDVVRKMMDGSLRILFESQDISRVRRYTQRQWRRILANKLSISEYIFRQEVRLGSYKPGHLPPAAIVATRAMQRDPRTAPRHGERVAYVVVYSSPQALLRDNVVAPEALCSTPGDVGKATSSSTSAHSLRINAHYYITKQIIPAMERHFSLLGVDVRAWFWDLPRPAVSLTWRAPAPPTKMGHKQGEKTSTFGMRSNTLHGYYASERCQLCRESCRDATSVCGACLSHAQSTLYISYARLRAAETAMSRFSTLCYNCVGWRDNNEIGCMSIDCPVFFERNKLSARTDELQSLVTLIQQGSHDESIT